MFAIQGRTLPANFGAYPVTVEDVEGHVLSIDGKAAFFTNAQCDAIGEYLRFGRESDTAPVEIVTSPEPQVQPPVTRRSRRQ